MKVGNGGDKSPVVIKISFYPLTNKSLVIYLFEEMHVNPKIDPHLQKENKTKRSPTQHVSHLRTKGMWKKHIYRCK